MDVEEFAPRPRAQATAELHALAAGLAEQALAAAPPAAERRRGLAFTRDPAEAARALRASTPSATGS